MVYLDDKKLDYLISHFLPELLSQDFKKISKEMDLSFVVIEHYLKILSKLEVKPGRNFFKKPAVYIVPDIHVYK